MGRQRSSDGGATWSDTGLRNVFSQADDLAAKHTDKLKALTDAFWTAAKKYQVLPLDDRLSERADPTRGADRPARSRVMIGRRLTA